MLTLSLKLGQSLKRGSLFLQNRKYMEKLVPLQQLNRTLQIMMNYPSPYQQQSFSELHQAMILLVPMPMFMLEER